MRILATGPESSGNRMLARMLTEAGATEVLHKPMPMSTHWRPGMPESPDNWDGVWTNFSDQYWDVALVIHRDWICTVESQTQAGHVRNLEHAIERTRQAICNIYSQLSTCGKPWYPVTYESLARPEAVLALCDILGLDGNKVETVWQDANAKYYGGETWGEHRPLWLLPRGDGSMPMMRNHPDFPKFNKPFQKRISQDD